MGYYTDFDIEAKPFETEEFAEFFEFKLKKASDYPFEVNIGGFDGNFHVDARLDSAKFYDYADVFRELSKEFPGVTIEIEGEGEENGDLWKHRFRNGNQEKVSAEFTFPDFKKITV